MADPNDFLAGDFNPTWDGALEGLDSYNPYTDSPQNYGDWYGSQGFDTETGRSDLYDIDFEGVSSQYQANAMINGSALHELNTSELMSFISEMGIDNNSQWSDNTREQFMADETMAGIFGAFAGGPDLSNLIEQYELKESQAYEQLADFHNLGAGQTLRDNIADLEEDYDSDLEAINLRQETALDQHELKKDSIREAALNSLLSSNKKSRRGVRRGSNFSSRSMDLDARLEALNALSVQDKSARKSARDEIAAAGTRYGVWEDGMLIGDPGLLQVGLQNAYNTAAFEKTSGMYDAMEVWQAEFDTQVYDKYDEWYADLTDQLADMLGMEFGPGGQSTPFDYFGGGFDLPVFEEEEVDEKIPGSNDSGGGAGGSEGGTEGPLGDDYEEDNTSGNMY